MDRSMKEYLFATTALVLLILLFGCASAPTATYVAPAGIKTYTDVDGVTVSDADFAALVVFDSGDGPAFQVPVLLDAKATDAAQAYFGIKAKHCDAGRGLIAVWQDPERSLLAFTFVFGAKDDSPWITELVRDVCTAGARKMQSGAYDDGKAHDGKRGT